MKTTNKDKFSVVRERIKDVRFCMLTTVEADGSLRSRPMATLQAEDDGVLWFFTSKNSGKADEIAHDAQVNFSYAEPEKQLMFSVSGKVTRIIKPRQKNCGIPCSKHGFHMDWMTRIRARLHIDVEQAEYWDAPSNKMVQLFGLVKAVVTGKQYDQGENEKLDPHPPNINNKSAKLFVVWRSCCTVCSIHFNAIKIGLCMSDGCQITQFVFRTDKPFERGTVTQQRGGRKLQGL